MKVMKIVLGKNVKVHVDHASANQVRITKVEDNHSRNKTSSVTIRCYTVPELDSMKGRK